MAGYVVMKVKPRLDLTPGFTSLRAFMVKIPPFQRDPYVRWGSKGGHPKGRTREAGSRTTDKER